MFSLCVKYFKGDKFHIQPNPDIAQLFCLWRRVERAGKWKCCVTGFMCTYSNGWCHIGVTALGYFCIMVHFRLIMLVSVSGVTSLNVTVGRDTSVGMATRYGLGGLGIESCRFQWLSGLRRGSAAYPLLGLRVRIPPGAWMFVSCVVSKRQKGKMQDNQDVQSTREYKKTYSSGGEIFLIRPDRPWGPLCLLYNGYRVCCLFLSRG